MNSFALSVAKLLNVSEHEEAFKKLIALELNQLGCNHYLLYSILDDHKTIFLDRSIDSKGFNHERSFYYENKLIATFKFCLEEDKDHISEDFFEILNTIFVFFYLKNSIKTERDFLLSKELKIAAKIQDFLIPTEPFSSNQIYAAGYHKPYFDLGGDYYDVIPLNDQKVAFCIADISGKGIDAALVMANFQAILRSLLLREFPIEQLIDLLNFKINEITKGEKYITLFLGIYNYEDHRLIYVNCGHNPPIMINKYKSFRLEEGTTILGAFEQLPFCQIGKHYIYQPVKIFLYTDGLMDLKVKNYNFPLSIDSIEKLCIDQLKNFPSQDFVNNLKIEIESPDSQVHIMDDISILAIDLC